MWFRKTPAKVMVCCFRGNFSKEGHPENALDGAGSSF